MAEDNQQRPVTGYVESASGTTNPDNANSGPAAWVIACVVVALLLVGSGFVASWVTDAIADAFAGYTDGDGEYYYEYEVDGDDDGYDVYGYTDDDFEREIRNRLEGQENGTSVDEGAGNLSVGEAIGEELAIYGDTIDDQVSASDYAGVDGDTRAWTRELVSLDADATSTVVRDLRSAARADDPADGIAQARSAAAQAADDIAALDVPEGAGEELASQLEAARDAAVVRWVAIDAELALLDTEGDVDASELATADASVSRATQDASEALTEALLAAAEARS